jgi:uncharacterized protein (DUF362 family)
MNISRRDFIKRMVSLGFGAAAGGALFSWLACNQKELPVSLPAPSSIPAQVPIPPVVSSVPTGNPYLAVVRGSSAAAIVQAAVKALGGIERFVKKGDDVIIKPNICVAYRTPEYAATTNPEVVSALVKLSLGAGAKRVRVMDFPFSGTAEEAYVRSGIGEAVKAAGGQMELMANMKYREVEIPGGLEIKKWSVYGDALDANVIINVPIAKHHSLGRLTLGMKNLMGLIQNRSQIHFNLGQRVADINSLLRPKLTVIDAVRVLMNHGPTGGSLDDVKTLNTVIASHDIVAADSYGSTLFGLKGDEIPIIRAGAQMGLGTMDLKSIKVEEISI